MNKKLMIVLVGVVFVISAGFVYLLTVGKPDMPKQAVSNQATANQPSTITTDTGQAGQYIDYSEAALAEASGTKILFFHAKWCPQCRALDADIRAGKIPQGVTIVKVDYDTNQALRQKYGVTLQTTLVKLDDKGAEAKKFVAYDTPSLQAVVDNLL